MFSNFTGRQGVSIFNRRRRPRQAVYASPQSQDVESFKRDEVMDDQLVNMARDFEGGQTNYGFPSHRQQPPGNFEKTVAKTRPLQQTRQLPLHKHPNNHHNPENTLVRQERCHEQQGLSNRERYPSSQRPTTKEFHFNKVSLTQPGQEPSHYRQTQGQYTWNHCNNYARSPAIGATAEPSFARQPLKTERAQGIDTQQKQMKIDKPATESAPGKGGYTLKSVDRTMKFVTSNIQGVRKWSEHRDTVPLIFEIFATLDSVPTSNNDGNAKFFNLKDSSGNIRAVYWEMVDWCIRQEEWSLSVLYYTSSTVGGTEACPEADINV